MILSPGSVQTDRVTPRSYSCKNPYANTYVHDTILCTSYTYPQGTYPCSDTTNVTPYPGATYCAIKCYYYHKSVVYSYVKTIKILYLSFHKSDTLVRFQIIQKSLNIIHIFFSFFFKTITQTVLKYILRVKHTKLIQSSSSVYYKSTWYKINHTCRMSAQNYVHRC